MSSIQYTLLGLLLFAVALGLLFSGSTAPGLVVITASITVNVIALISDRETESAAPGASGGGDLAA